MLVSVFRTTSPPVSTKLLLCLLSYVGVLKPVISWYGRPPTSQNTIHFECFEILQKEIKKGENLLEVTLNLPTPMLLIFTAHQQVNLYFLYLRLCQRKINYQYSLLQTSHHQALFKMLMNSVDALDSNAISN